MHVIIVIIKVVYGAPCRAWTFITMVHMTDLVPIIRRVVDNESQQHFAYRVNRCPLLFCYVHVMQKT